VASLTRNYITTLSADLTDDQSIFVLKRWAGYLDEVNRGGEALGVLTGRLVMCLANLLGRNLLGFQSME